MTHLRLSWEDDLKLRLRFLELLFLISTLLVGLNPEQITGITANGLLLFIIFGAVHYFIVSNGLLQTKLLTLTAGLTSYSFAAVYSSIFYNLGPLEFSSGISYFVLIGLVVGLGILPKKISYKIIDFLGKNLPLPQT